MKKWKAQIYNGRDIHLGFHTCEINAALAYDRKCRELRGKTAVTNFD
tara:strand:- start:150 stop:290 length:141 start_codon:yes stop_codon:yes gene_type:complete